MRLKLVEGKKKNKFSPEENKFKHVVLMYADRILFSPMLLLKIKPGPNENYIISAEDLDEPGTFYIQFTSDSSAGYGLKLDEDNKGYKMFKSLKKKMQEMFPPSGIYELERPTMYEGKMWYKMIPTK